MQLLKNLASVSLLLLSSGNLVKSNAIGISPLKEHESSSSLSEPHLRHRQLQKWCPDYPSNNNIVFNITKETIENTKILFDLLLLVTCSESGPIQDLTPEQKEPYETLVCWSDWNDQTLVAKSKTSTPACFALFQGTNSLNPLDYLQNANIFSARVKDSDCLVRSGYKNGYFTKYYEEFITEVDNCVASCTGQCPLFLGGYSQGGSIAVVASIDLRHYNPTIITFGAPRVAVDSHKFPCHDANPQNHYRYMNQLEDEYDCVANMIPDFNGKHMGTSLILDDTNWPIRTGGINDNLSRTPRGFGPHDRDLYRSRVDEIFVRKCYPLPVVSVADD
ncbi:unknown protein [Seminavis robusta]|uniref:Fungal lipase-type domain-containing protein n=1 Tax=Seminavis robusta TaxID=568900 RepID=A0A9N8DYB8_9STRA|nr:unknown protein [Seminavis robusta]|eukprot:Sro471_g149800.1 n/a (333) ;mRNA; f:58695-59954